MKERNGDNNCKHEFMTVNEYKVCKKCGGVEHTGKDNVKKEVK